MSNELEQQLREWQDQQAIRDVVLRYCRALDRRDLDDVRDCFHPDATDDHGGYTGDVAGFIAYCRGFLARFERTMHFVGNLLVDVHGDLARSEAYTIAHHWIAPQDGRLARDHIVAFRYVDDLERRDGTWKILRRVCVFEWTRTDEISNGWDFGPGHIRGRHDETDPVHAPLLPS